MTVSTRVMAAVVVVAFFSAKLSATAQAQSFYETITAVARTEAPSKPRAPIIEAPAAPTVSVPPRRPAVTISPKTSRKQTNAKQTSPKAPAPGTMAAKVKSSQDRWENADIQIARARCRHSLRSIDAQFIAMEPIKNGMCGDPAPIKLSSIGSNPRVAIEPAVIVNCDMAVALHNWLTNDLQPLARKHLRSPIVAIESMSSYSCRNAYGRKDARLSQHARANAIDIRGFVTARQSKTRLLSHWGPTQRAIKAAALARQRAAEKKRLAKLKADKALIAKAKTTQPSAPEATQLEAAQVAVAPSAAPRQADQLPGVRPSILEGLSTLMSGNSFANNAKDENSVGFAIAPSRLGGPALASAGSAQGREHRDAEPSWPVYLVSKNVSSEQSNTPSARFLRDAHTTACRLFGTVLGPEANNAHRNHFHVDLANRKLGAYCR